VVQVYTVVMVDQAPQLNAGIAAYVDRQVQTYDVSGVAAGAPGIVVMASVLAVGFLARCVVVSIVPLMMWPGLR